MLNIFEIICLYSNKQSTQLVTDFKFNLARKTELVELPFIKLPVSVLISLGDHVKKVCLHSVLRNSSLLLLMSNPFFQLLFTQNIALVSVPPSENLLHIFLQNYLAISYQLLISLLNLSIILYL
jgi:hypothetical protein